jgi:hypothetical protein
MSKIAVRALTRSAEFLPIALVGFGLIATAVWTSSLMALGIFHLLGLFAYL